MNINQKALYIFVILVGLCSYKTFGQASEIPQALKEDPMIMVKPPLVNQAPLVYHLIDLEQGQTIPAFPDCNEFPHSYYVGAQLSYDFSDRAASEVWSASLNITFYIGSDAIWTKPLDLSLENQLFISTIFHPTAIICDGTPRFEITSKILNGSVPSDKIDLSIFRYQELENNFNPALTFTVTNPTITNDEISLAWNPSSNYVIAYDVEWVFVDSYEATTINTRTLAFSRKEPVRITTVNKSYKFKSFYPTGKIWYRVREVGHNPQYPTLRIVGTWRYASNSVSITNPQSNLNWQEQTIYAEEGKYKKVINYFDGTLRQRQSVTNLSTERISLVADTYYDYEGRASLSTLAVPATNADLKFSPTFNSFSSIDPQVTANTSSSLNKYHYDNSIRENSTISETSGAGNYYSPYNLLKDERKGAYIPDAEGYPYHQTEYLRDGTGRISKQSGVGATFKMDGNGKVVKYYYGEASPFELIRLFGSNVGKASHYSKNIVVDANGQASVSYVDQEGRTVATALAGESPTVVNELPSYTALSTGTRLININQKNKKQGIVSQTVHKILNEVEDENYEFKYSLSSLSSDLQNLGCQTCKYDLMITLTDPNGQKMVLSGISGNQTLDPENRAFERKNLETPAANCSTSTELTNITFSVTLPEIGDYTLTKTLIAKEKTVEEIKTIVRQNASFQQEVLQLESNYPIDETECEICVQDCEETDDLIEESMQEVANLNCENIYNEILRSGLAIESHPLYCKYTACIKDQLSAIYEMEMARIPDWTTAKASGYTNLVNTDPFFNNSDLSGASKKSDMITELNNISSPDIKYYNTNSQDESNTPYRLSGTLDQITDPYNTNFYINDRGQRDAEKGFHFLYFDLMSKRAKIGEASFERELNKQRWHHYRSQYLEAKRKTKLIVYDCASLEDELNKMNTVMSGITPGSESSIEIWGSKQDGGTGSVSNAELEMSISAITMSCDINLNLTDYNYIKTQLSGYFNTYKSNIFRHILLHHLTNGNSYLNNINARLASYNCNLSSVAINDPLVCIRDTVVYVFSSYVPLPIAPPAFGSSQKDNGTADLSLLESEKQNSNKKETGFLSLFKKKEARIVSSQAVQSNSYIPSQAEYDALMELYSSTGGPTGWSRKAGWENASPGTTRSVQGWEGVVVDVNTGHITELNLSSNNLVGFIPSSINELKYLKVFKVASNKLRGLPNNFASGWQGMVTMDLSNNYLNSLPDNICNGCASGVSINANYNNLSFTELMVLRTSYPTSTFSNQNKVGEATLVRVTIGGSVSLIATVDRNTSPESLYRWYKVVDGVHVALNSGFSASNHTFTLTNITSNHLTAQFYYKIYNSAMSSVTLTSNPYILVEGESRALTYCIEYGLSEETNPWFKYDVDWELQFNLCMADAAQRDDFLMELATEKLLDQRVGEYLNSSRTMCLANATENMSYSYVSKEHHYTLYYYDQAGNLVQTVPPRGVKPIDDIVTINNFMNGTATATSNPSHTLLTKYKYNSLNQLIWQQTPDAGISNFWYDGSTRLRLSQNAQQKTDKKYSYTKYDAQGRVIEVGEMAATSLPVALSDSLNSPTFPVSGQYVLSDITRTHYDQADPRALAYLNQEFLRSRVAWVEVIDKSATDTTLTWYSYDPHGNVKAVVHRLPGFAPKRTDYVYDLVSGKVNYVYYQFGKPEQLIHKYDYDADNRLHSVETSTDGYIWNTDAVYDYYAHGPLARIDLGQARVQGLDYYYTLQGWLKGVNMPRSGDPGKDGIGLSYVGRDAMAFTLGYYQGDYQPINASKTTVDIRDLIWTRLNETHGYTGLYNGNIAWMVTDLPSLGLQQDNRDKGMQAMLYKYDQLHRIRASRSLTEYAANGGFAARTAGFKQYDEDYTYDPNGNLLTLDRFGPNGAQLDDYNYMYAASNNRLLQVEDYTIAVDHPASKTYNTSPITSDNQKYDQIIVEGDAQATNGSNNTLTAVNSIRLLPNFRAVAGSIFKAKIVAADSIADPAGNYVYNAIGNLTKDKADGTTITWTPYGKVRTVAKTGMGTISYRYDAAGNRIEKKVVKSGSPTIYTRYIRDAAGTVMAIYNDTTVIEQPVYGSSRLGEIKGQMGEGKLVLGNRSYELSNHLGNVLAVVSDKFIIVDADGAEPEGGGPGGPGAPGEDPDNPDAQQEVPYQVAQVQSTRDYHPFGLEMAGRTWSDTTTYRYGFNGKEKDQFGGSNVYDYGFRIYNPRIAKFLSVDPLTKSYPWFTPYQFAGNMPIAAVDLDGLEPKIVTSPGTGVGGRTISADEINAVLQSAYEQAMKENYIYRDPDGNHKFDAVRAFNDTRQKTKGMPFSKVLSQFSEFKKNSDAELIKHDKLFYNGQSHRAALLKKEEFAAIMKQKQNEDRIYRQAKINAEKGKSGAIIDIAIGSAAAVFSSVEIVTSWKTGGAELGLAFLSLGFSVDQITGGFSLYNSIDQKTFDPNKDYKMIGGFVQEIGGENAMWIYDATSLILGSTSAYKNISKISGKELNDLAEGAQVTVYLIEVGKKIDDSKNKK